MPCKVCGTAATYHCARRGRRRPKWLIESGACYECVRKYWMWCDIMGFPHKNPVTFEDYLLRKLRRQLDEIKTTRKWHKRFDQQKHDRIGPLSGKRILIPRNPNYSRSHGTDSATF